MPYPIRLLIFLLALWMLLSGHFTPLLLAFGLASALLTLWLTLRMHRADGERYSIRLSAATIGYWGWLLKEILVSSLQVGRQIVAGRIRVTPSVIKVRASQHSRIGRVLYANSITLTPGTLTLSVQDDEFEIHSLDTAYAEGLQSGDMDRRVAAVERIAS